MEIDDYQLEADKRVNAVVTEVSVLKETIRHMDEAQAKTDKKLDEIKSAVTDLTTSLKLSQYQMSEMIDKKLEPIYKEMEENRNAAYFSKGKIAAYLSIATVAAAILSPFLQAIGKKFGL